jgi:hypothetical protein
MRGWYGSWLIVLAGMSSTGCDDYAGEDADATDPRLQRKLGLSTCGAWRCGYNAAEINGRSLQTLHLQGLANADGVRIVGFVPPPLRFGYSLAVEGDALVAKRPGSTLAGAQLIGATILVRVQTDLVLPVVIAGYDAVPSWADGGGTIAAYTLLYLDPDTLVTRSVCTGTPLDVLTSAVTVMGGETYDEATKTVVPDQSGWFTLACAGSAAAKMKLMGYAPQTELPGTAAPSTVAQRQATLKMITADYCGTGHSYTANGAPIVWQNQVGTVDSSDWHAPGDIEAVWTAEGASCLGATRLPDATPDCPLAACSGEFPVSAEWITHIILD